MADQVDFKIDSVLGKFYYYAGRKLSDMKKPAEEESKEKEKGRENKKNNIKKIKTG